MCVTLYDARNEEFLIRVESLAGIRIERVEARALRDVHLLDKY